MFFLNLLQGPAMKNSRKKFLKWRRENYPLLETRHE